jgi:hypothetical protein
MEFGVSPMPETRRKMIERGTLFGSPGFRWIPARTVVKAAYCALVASCSEMPRRVRWDGNLQAVLE